MLCDPHIRESVLFVENSPLHAGNWRGFLLLDVGPRLDRTSLVGKLGLGVADSKAFYRGHRKCSAFLL